MLKILYGILGLGLIILIHETGHFVAAKICGVVVESFSIGMGPVLLHKTIKGTDYRLSLIPLGGYCGMKGEKAFQDALDQNLPAINGTPDSFYGVHPLKRVFIAFFGPFFNVLFAFIAYVIISMVGYNYYTTSNQIILANEVYPEIESTAEEAGIKTGDIITKIDKTEINNFSDLQTYIAVHPDEELDVTVLRNNRELIIPVRTTMDRSTGSGKIGIMSWIDPVVSSVMKDSSAWKAGIEPGSIITHIDGKPVFNTADISRAIEKRDSVAITWETSAGIKEGVLDLITDNIGLQFQTMVDHTPKYNFFPAIWEGLKKTGSTIGLTFKSIGLLFKGVDFKEAVSGPIRITKMLGETAVEGFSAGFSTGIVVVLDFLALISISLFIMNLLPIPVLDGGLVLFALIEAITRKPIKPKILYYIQFVGIGIILILFVIAMYGDLHYLFKGM